MQQTVYKCDQCKREIGKKPHISLVLNQNHMGCGIAVPPAEGKSAWRVVHFARNFVHFCDETHAAKWFKAHLDAAKPVADKKKKA